MKAKVRGKIFKNQKNCSKSIIHKTLAFYFVGILLFSSNFVYAQGKIDSQPSDTKGIVLGASVARSKMQEKTKLPVETYFGNPNLESISDQLKEHNVNVYPEDEVTVFPNPQLNIGSVIRITRATPVRIIDGNRENEYRTWESDIKDLLQKNNITLGQDDKLEPNIDGQITPNLVIKITRVEYTKITETEKIPFKTQKKDDPTLDKGLTKTLQRGVNGERKKIFEVRRENGEEIERKLISNDVVKESTDEIIAVGTKQVTYGTGKATWFGAPAMTAAHNSLPKGTMVEVTNLANGKSVVVKIIGGGIMGSAIIDLSPDAFEKLAPLGTGVIQVRLTKP